MNTIRVRAVGDAKLPVPGVLAARYVGRNRDGSVIGEGVVVPADSYHKRAVERGDLELVEVSS
jgi:hypothetical protein